jgi:hypothetical protein
MPGTFAYITSRATGTPDEQRSEFGVHAHGPRAAKLDSQFARHVQQWDRGQGHGQAHVDQVLRDLAAQVGIALIDIPRGLTTAERVRWTSARLADQGLP